MTDFVTQDERVSDLEDVAYIKQRVTQLEKKVKFLENFILENRDSKSKHKKECTDSFIGFPTCQKQDFVLDSSGG